VHTYRFESQKEFDHYISGNPIHRERLLFERRVLAGSKDLDSFVLHGHCKACGQDSTFLVDRLYGSRASDGNWQPNWRERLVCSSCQLNNRQRAMVHVLQDSLNRRRAKEQVPTLYVQEQVTPLYDWLNENLRAQVAGSEFMGPDVPGGSLVDGVIPGIRHENAEALSFEKHTFDIIVSNDVLEHVDQPEQAVAEMMRVLKPGGELFLTIPFHTNRAGSERRAGLENGELVHYLPEQYHGNPLSEKGSLVFHDFGWDFIALLKQSRFRQAALCSYWSDQYGYLGDPQFYIHAVKKRTIDRRRPLRLLKRLNRHRQRPE